MLARLSAGPPALLSAKNVTANFSLPLPKNKVALVNDRVSRSEARHTALPAKVLHHKLPKSKQASHGLNRVLGSALLRPASYAFGSGARTAA